MCLQGTEHPINGSVKFPLTFQVWGQVCFQVISLKGTCLKILWLHVKVWGGDSESQPQALLTLSEADGIDAARESYCIQYCCLFRHLWQVETGSGTLIQLITKEKHI